MTGKDRLKRRRKEMPIPMKRFLGCFSVLLSFLAAAMERYLALVPDAPDARAARDKIYPWKGRLP